MSTTKTTVLRDYRDLTGNSHVHITQETGANSGLANLWLDTTTHRATLSVNALLSALGAPDPISFRALQIENRVLKSQLEQHETVAEEPEPPTEDDPSIDRSWALQKAGEALERMPKPYHTPQNALRLAEWLLAGEGARGGSDA